jgi:hypothetical protein
MAQRQNKSFRLLRHPLDLYRFGIGETPTTEYHGRGLSWSLFHSLANGSCPGQKALCKKDTLQYPPERIGLIVSVKIAAEVNFIADRLEYTRIVPRI